jgi:hypothetical protein
MIALILNIVFLSSLAAMIIFILHQAASYFKSVKIWFVATFMLYWTMVFSDCLKNHLLNTESAADFNSKIGVSSALFVAIAVEQLALALCREKQPKLSWKRVLSKKLYIVSILYNGYIILLLLLTWVLGPWQVQQIQSVWGGLIYDSVYASWYLVCLAIVLLAFIAYPCMLFLKAGRKFKKTELAGVLNWFGVGWIGIGSMLIIFHGLLPALNVQIIEISHLFNLAFFGIIAYAFRKTTVLESLFERLYTSTYAPRPTGLIKNSEAFSKALGLTHEQVVGKNILLEFDPTSDYERVIEDFVDETLANADPVAVFTSKGGIIHSALGNRSDVKFLVLTQRVSTPQADASKNKILLPANNSSLLLDALNKVLKAYPERNASIVFDNLSSLILFIGFEKTYGFLRYALELLALENGTSLFLFDPRAHDIKVASAFRSLFSDQITYGKEGLRVVRIPESSLKS